MHVSFILVWKYTFMESEFHVQKVKFFTHKHESLQSLIWKFWLNLFHKQDYKLQYKSNKCYNLQYIVSAFVISLCLKIYKPIDSRKMTFILKSYIFYEQRKPLSFLEVLHTTSHTTLLSLHRSDITSNTLKCLRRKRSAILICSKLFQKF